MEEIKSATQLLKEETQRILDERHKENVIVLVNLPSERHTMRLTYENIKSSKLLSIDEINAAEEALTSSSFKGRGCTGWCSANIKEIKKLLSGIKIKDWEANEDMVVDIYYQKH